MSDERTIDRAPWPNVVLSIDTGANDMAIAAWTNTGKLPEVLLAWHVLKASPGTRSLPAWFVGLRLARMVNRVLMDPWIERAMYRNEGLILVETHGSSGILGDTWRTKKGEVRSAPSRDPWGVTLGMMATGHLLGALSSNGNVSHLVPVPNTLWRAGRKTESIREETRRIVGHKISEHASDAIALGHWFLTRHHGQVASLMAHLHQTADARKKRKARSRALRAAVRRQGGLGCSDGTSSDRGGT